MLRKSPVFRPLSYLWGDMLRNTERPTLIYSQKSPHFSLFEVF